MITRKPILVLVGLLALLLSLAIFPAGAAPAGDNAPVAFAVQDSTVEPTTGPAEPTMEPTVVPTEPPPEPTAEPTLEVPTEVPTHAPPTEAPTEEPTAQPTLDPGDPTPEPTTDPTVEPTGPVEELSAFFITKLFCATIDEEAEDPCTGRVTAAEGTTVYFEVTHLESGYAETFPVEIEVVDGYTFGSLYLYDAPFGTYRVTEIAPAGYDAFAVPGTESQVADGASLTFELGAAEEEAFFVNVPFASESPGTTVPDPAGKPEPTAPDVSAPDITPGAGAPITDDSTVSVLPDTGAQAAATGARLFPGLELALAGLLLIAAFVVRRMSRR